MDSSNASSIAQFALIAESFSHVHLRPWLAATWSSAYVGFCIIFKY
uniref:Uncharacterized protein n=1 Tax=Arundo donax TaxID=35708 RepID=A0A0A9EFH5_ARUDO